MKTLIIIATLIFLICCKETVKSNYDTTTDGRAWNIILENNLGILTIILPKHLDTLFTWTQYSDCGDGCASLDYRVQPKSLPIFKDNGFIYHPLTDSVEQFTIKHPKLTQQWPINDASLVRQFSGRLKNEAFENYSKSFSIDTIISIDKMPFAIIGFNSFDSTKKTTVQILNAMTAIDGNVINFFFECRKSYLDSSSTNFIHKSFDALQTVRLSNSR